LELDRELFAIDTQLNAVNIWDFWFNKLKGLGFMIYQLPCIG
jgi:hypothetical protein